MKGQIDLMPSSCRDALGRRVWMQRWISVYTLVATVLLTTWWGVGVGWSAQEREHLALQEQVRLMYERNEDIQDLLKQIEELEGSITRHNRLASPVRVSEAVRVLASLMPEGVSLNSLAVSPREQKAATAPAKQRGKDAEPAKPEPPRVFLVIEAEGLSRGDAPIAGFVAGLEQNVLFSKVALDYTRSVDELASGARGFRVTCEIDLSRSYEFVASNGYQEPSSEGVPSQESAAANEEVAP